MTEPRYRHRQTGDIGVLVSAQTWGRDGPESKVTLEGLTPGTRDLDQALHVFPVERQTHEVRYDPILSNNKPSDFVPGRASLGSITLRRAELDDPAIWERVDYEAEWALDPPV